MRVADAKQIAREWLRDYLPTVPNLVGALFAGSISFKPDDAPFPAGSDIDLFIYQKHPGTPRPPKLPHRGVILEPSHHAADIFDDYAKLLAQPHEAPHVTGGEIIHDPAGVLRRAKEAVAPEYPKLHWVRQRMDWASRNATGKLGGCVNATGDVVGPLCSFALGIRNIAALAPIATLGNPTLRRCLVVARDVLQRHGHGALHEELLDALGSRATTPAAAHALVEPTMALYRRATAVVKTPFWAKFELNTGAEQMFRHGIEEMLDAGDHREAMLFVLFVHYFCGEAIAHDGSDADKRLFADTLALTAGAVGGQTTADIRERSKRALALLPRYQLACEEAAAAHPGVSHAQPAR